jgi:phosphoribulokinase
MSKKGLIVAVTGSTGAGLSTVRHAFKTIFRRLEVNAAIVHGDAFRRYTEAEFAAQLAAARASGRNFSSLGPECNHFAELEGFFKAYSETGSGMVREYAHNAERAGELGVPVGEFTAWQPLAASCRKPGLGVRWMRATSRRASTGASTAGVSMWPSMSTC